MGSSRLLEGQDAAGSNRRLLAKVGVSGETFVTDEWNGCHRLISEDQLSTGKDLTFPIEQDHSNVRHDLARFCGKTKTASKCRTMPDLSLRRLHHLQEPANYAAYAKKFLPVFAWNSQGVSPHLQQNQALRYQSPRVLSSEMSKDVIDAQKTAVRNLLKTRFCCK